MTTNTVKPVREQLRDFAEWIRTPKRLLLTGIAVLLVVAVFGQTSNDDGGYMPDTRSCAELLTSFNIASETVRKFDRGTIQWETAEREKWAAYDRSRAKGCGDF